MKELAADLQKDRSHQNQNATKHIVRFPRLIRRFPRLPAGDLAIEPQLVKRIAELDESAFPLIALRHTTNLELGRIFEQEKEALGHGKWVEHFEEVFAPLGISLRTAERYMRRAKREDAIKFDNLSNLKSASDEGARAVKDADERAEAEVKAARSRTPTIDEHGLYKLMLHMRDEEKILTDRLCLSPDWPRAEREVLRLLRRLWVEYDIIDEEVEE
jgi:hypothetical protein